MELLEKFQKIISLGEGFTLEFKKSGTSNLGREFCAFANTSGGTILIGVNDKGEITGVKNHNKLKSEIQSIARSIEPTIIIKVESIANIIVIKVPEQNKKPYSFAGKFYMREGASSQQLTRNEIREFFHKEGIISFDEMKNNWFEMDKDFTDEQFQIFAKKAKIPEGLDKFQVFENLHLIKNKNMTNAGAWLLAKDIQKFNISANAICAIFMGRTKTKILDSREFNSDLYSVYQGIITYLQEKLNTEFIITARGRIEKLELPEDALREAVVNALAHRDYRSNANVQVHIFHDRVEITNPGGLPAGMTPELLGIKSIPRNPLLFSIFHRMDMVEKLGSGIKRIKQLCKDYGVREPEINIEENWFTIIFKRNGLEERESELISPKKANKNDLANIVNEPVTKLGAESKIMNILSKSDLSMQEIANALNRESITGSLKRTIRKLLNKDIIERTIPEKPNSRLQKYKITEKGKQILKGNSDE